MRVLQVIPSFYPSTRYGGPPESVLRLSQALMNEGITVRLVTTDADGPGHNLDVAHGREVDVDGVPVRYCRRFPRIEFAPSAELTWHLTRVVPRHDLVHITALFSFPSTIAALTARRFRVPYVISPRGACMPWGFAQRRWKKLPYWYALDRPSFRHAAGLHATAYNEAERLRQLVPTAHVFTVPNPIAVPAPPPNARREEGRVIFLGRLHPKKGFDVLIPAMSRLARRLPDVELVIAGPDHDGEWSRTKERIARERPRPRVRYVGVVQGEDKARLLASAQVLVLSSHSENFGMVVAEALACGTPVVVSKNCPWPEVEQAGAGHWVDNDPPSIAGALERVLRAPDGGEGYREAARRLATSFAPSQVGPVMAEAYREIVGARA